MFDVETCICEAWSLTEPVMRSVNGFISRCLHVITGQDYRVTATFPEYDPLRAIRQRRLRYICHILCMPERRVVRRALVALAEGTIYPKSSRFIDCQVIEMNQLVALAQRRVECTGQTIALRRTTTVPLEPLGLIWNSYIQPKVGQTRHEAPASPAGDWSHECGISNMQI